MEEYKAIKWYNSSAYAYFRKMGARLDMIYSESIKVLNQFSTNNNNNDNDNNVYMIDCIHLLNNELKSLQDILYGHPDMEGATPRAFVNADDEAKKKKENTEYLNLENDEIEITSVTSISAANKLKNILH